MRTILRTTSRPALVLLAIAAGACGTTTQNPDATSNQDVTTAMDALADIAADNPLQMHDDVPQVDVPPAAEHDYAAPIGPIHLDPGQEVTMCVLRRLGNETGQFVRSASAQLGAASHHLIFYRSQETTERTTPFECNGFSGLENISNPDSPILIAQNAVAHIDFPSGTGMRIAANQMVRIELHAINVTANPMDVTSMASIHSVDDSVALTPADMLFWGNANIHIPAHTQADVHFYHRPWSGVRIFGLTSHTHSHGTLATINVATNATTDSSMSVNVREVHRSLSWSDPPLTMFDPPMQLESGQGLHLQCHYNNTTDQQINFGESFNDEMCFMWAYYYPAPRGLQICGEYGSGTICLPP